MTSRGRQQMAYQHYVKKYSGRKMTMQKKIKPVHMPLTPGPSENKINAEAETPQSVTSGESQNGDQQ